MNMIYNNCNRNYRNSLGDFIKNYSINNYGREWNYCVNLSNKYNVKNNKWRNNIKGLLKYISNYDKNLDGFIFNEYDINYTNIHHHIILKSDIKNLDINKYITNYWKKYGMSEIKKYDKNLNYCHYITKHTNKLDENEFEMIKTFI